MEKPLCYEINVYCRPMAHASFTQPNLNWASITLGQIINYKSTMHQHSVRCAGCKHFTISHALGQLLNLNSSFEKATDIHMTL